MQLVGNDANIKERKRAYQCDATEELVYIHPESALYNEYVCRRIEQIPSGLSVWM